MCKMASKTGKRVNKTFWKNLYRFYSGCRQTILFTWRGGMGVDGVHDVLDVSASCTMFLTSVDHVHDGHDVFDVS